MIEQLCGAAGSGSSDAVVILAKQLPVADKTELRSALGAMVRGAQERCPDVDVDWRSLLDDVFLSSAGSFEP
jgi:hypothetical protein